MPLIRVKAWLYTLQTYQNQEVKNGQRHRHLGTNIHSYIAL